MRLLENEVIDHAPVLDFMQNINGDGAAAKKAHRVLTGNSLPHKQ